MSKVIVSQQSINLAYGHFMECFYPDGSSKGLYFWKFIGLKTQSEIQHDLDGWPLPEGPAHIVSLMAGPHYQAICKALVANGHEYLKEL